MSIRQNPGYFNSPEIAQAASNLAGLFAPPDGGEAANWALANQRKAETERLAWLFDHPTDATASERAALTGVQAFGNTPDGFAASDLTQRYGYDTKASADRDVATINNAGARERMGVIDATEVEKQKLSGLAGFYGNVAQDAIRPEVPASVASRFGMPQALPAVTGLRSPLSEAQVKGGILSDLRSKGAVPDQVFVDAIMGAETPVQAVGPDGQTPRFMSPGAAVRTGAEPFVQDRSPGSVRMYKTRDGRTGRTVDGLTDMVTHQPVPADATVGSISDTSESFGTTELSKARETILGRRAGVESMARQVVALDEQLAGADAAQAIGIVGSSSRIMNDIAVQAGAALGAIGVEAPQALRDTMKYQETFRTLGVQNADLQSGLLDLAYATAQSREPGKLTEADIDRSLRTIGANLQDPAAMRHVLRGAVKRAMSDYEATESTLMNAFGDSLNLQPARFTEVPPLEGATALTARPAAAASTPPPRQNGNAVVQTQRGPVTIRRID